MADPDIPLVARRGVQRRYESARGTDYNALADRHTQNSSVRPPPLNEKQLAGLEGLEYDYWKLRDEEFTKRYGRSRMDYWKSRELLVKARNEHLRAQEEAIRIQEETHGKLDVDRQRQAEEDLSNVNRALEAVRSSPLASAFLLYANARGGSLEQQRDAAELGQATAALGGAVTVVGAAANSRRELQNYRGSAGLTLPGPAPAPRAGPPSSPRAPKSEASPTPRTIERRERQPQITESDRQVTDENRGLISARDPALDLPRRSSRLPRTQPTPAVKPPSRQLPEGPRLPVPAPSRQPTSPAQSGPLKVTLEDGSEFAVPGRREPSLRNSTWTSPPASNVGDPNAAHFEQSMRQSGTESLRVWTGGTIRARKGRNVVLAPTDVEFDDYRLAGKTLVDAKSQRGAQGSIMDPRRNEWTRKIIRQKVFKQEVARQIAGADKVVWKVQDKEVADALSKFFNDEGFHTFDAEGP